MLGLEKPSSRFNLLLLDENEYYLDDFTADYYPPMSDNKALSLRTHVLKGRLKLCTNSIFFVPEDIEEPITKFPLKNMFSIGVSKRENSFAFTSEVYIEMSKGDEIYPYVFVKKQCDHLFVLTYSTPIDILLPLKQLYTYIHMDDHFEANQLISSIVKEREEKLIFNKGWLKDDEIHLLELSVHQIKPLITNPGKVMLTTKRLYFQPLNHLDSEPIISFELKDLKRIVRRRYLLQHNAIELFFENKSPLFFNFKSSKAREDFYLQITSLPITETVSNSESLAALTLKWQKRELSNFDYLLALNYHANRSFNDLTQYPVFPWIIKDYTSSTLDLNNPNSFRDLSKPIGALNEFRLERLRTRYFEMPEPKFLYGTHYSTPAYVLYYLVRQAPQYMLKLQGGKFDSADRMFFSIQETWDGVLKNPADLKELIPEFYCQSEFLVNSDHLPLGTKSNGDFLNDVELPKWAESPADFISKMRQALESDYVSKHLNLWIDLIFGCKQRSFKDNNVFYNLTYEEDATLAFQNANSQNEIDTLLLQIGEFGQTPSKLFNEPHPERDSALPEIQSIDLQDNIIVKAQSPKITEHNENLNHDSIIQKLLQLNIGFSFAPHQSKINCMSLSKNERLFTVGHDSTVKVHNINNLFSHDAAEISAKQIRNHIAEFEPLCCSLNEDDEKTLYFGSMDNTISTYTVEVAKVNSFDNIHNDSISCISVKNGLVATGSLDTSAKISIQTNNNIQRQPLFVFEFDSSIYSIAMDNLSKLLACGSEDGTLYLASLKSGEVINQQEAHSDVISGLAFSNDAELVISCSIDGHIRIAKLDGQLISLKQIDSSVNCLWSDGNICIFGCETLIALLDINSLQLDILTASKGKKYTSVVADVENCCILGATDDGHVYIFK